VRAILCHDFTEPLQVRDVGEPALGSEQVRVEVQACGVNFVDGLIVSGRYQLKPNLPHIPGFEVAGTVIEVGEKTGTWSVGDRVMATCGLRGGGYAEQVVVDEKQAFLLPPTMTAGQGATFIQSYCTALFALTERTRLAAGSTLLVLGASGGVGRAAVDVGTALGAKVIAAASSAERLRTCDDIGPYARLDYSQEDLKTGVRALADGGADVAYDPLGGNYAEQALRALGDDGVLLVIGFAAGQIPRLPANQILLRNRRVVGVDWGGWRSKNPGLQDHLMTRLLDLVEGGRLHPREPRTYPFSDVNQALEDVSQRQLIGKVVLVP